MKNNIYLYLYKYISITNINTLFVHNPQVGLFSFLFFFSFFFLFYFTSFIPISHTPSAPFSLHKKTFFYSVLLFHLIWYYYHHSFSLYLIFSPFSIHPSTLTINIAHLHFMIPLDSRFAVLHDKSTPTSARYIPPPLLNSTPLLYHCPNSAFQCPPTLPPPCAGQSPLLLQ